jgi:glycosyltransferase involved in cell wall biosynthesis
MRHLHFVQSIESLQGGGLGQAALGMHLAMIDQCPSKLVVTCKTRTLEYLPSVIECQRVGPSSLYFSSNLLKIAKDLVHKSDWVHGHGFYVATNAILGAETLKQGKPLCYHAHGFFDPWILNRSSFKKRMVRFLFEDRNFRNVRLWRALTSKEASQIRSVGMRSPIEVLPNGIRIEEIDQPTRENDVAKYTKQSKSKRVLFLGRIHPKKGLDLLIAAWAKLASHHHDWELTLVGPDEGGYLATVKSMIVNADLTNSVRVYDVVSGPEKVAVFRSSDLFVLPSYSEGFPVAIVEAAAHRLPCVITTECNFPELVEAGGAWESLPTIDSFTEVLRQALLVDDQERRQRGECGRALIESRYTWDVIAKQMNDACSALG